MTIVAPVTLPRRAAKATLCGDPIARASMASTALAMLVVVSGCHPAQPPTASATTATATGTASIATPATAPRRPVTLTYLGVAGWQITDGSSTVLVDPYFSRPRIDHAAVMSIDEGAVAAHVPPRADVILVGHTHVDHALDVPAVSRLTGAQVVGSVSTTRYARAAGVPEDHLIPVKGGEDYAFGAFSVRVLPGLHSALSDKHTMGGSTELADPVRLPLTFDQFVEGGTFNYLVRMSGHEILILSSANYIERELDGLRPDIAIVATGLRQEIHDYTCRLLRSTGAPPRILVNHFDAWQAPLVPTPPLSPDAQADLAAFAAEVRACAPQTTVTVPTRFAPIVID